MIMVGVRVMLFLVLLDAGSWAVLLDVISPMDGTFTPAPVSVRFALLCEPHDTLSPAMETAHTMPHLNVNIEINGYLVATVSVSDCSSEEHTVQIVGRFASAPTSHALRVVLQRDKEVMGIHHGFFWTEERRESLQAIQTLLAKRREREREEALAKESSAASKMAVVSLCECSKQKQTYPANQELSRVEEANRWLARRLDMSFTHSCRDEDSDISTPWKDRNADWMNRVVQNQLQALQEGRLTTFIIIDCETILLKRSLQQIHTHPAIHIGYSKYYQAHSWIVIKGGLPASQDVHASLLAAVSSLSIRQNDSAHGSPTKGHMDQSTHKNATSLVRRVANYMAADLRTDCAHSKDVLGCLRRPTGDIVDLVVVSEEEDKDASMSPGVCVSAVLARVCCPQAAHMGCSACIQGPGTRNEEDDSHARQGGGQVIDSMRSRKDDGDGVENKDREDDQINRDAENHMHARSSGQVIDLMSSREHDGDGGEIIDRELGHSKRDEIDKKQGKSSTGTIMWRGDDGVNIVGSVEDAEGEVNEEQDEWGAREKSKGHAEKKGEGWHLGIVVPLRGREDSRQALVKGLHAAFEGRCNYTIWVVEQDEFVERGYEGDHDADDDGTCCDAPEGDTDIHTRREAHEESAGTSSSPYKYSAGDVLYDSSGDGEVSAHAHDASKPVITSMHSSQNPSQNFEKPPQTSQNPSQQQGATKCRINACRSARRPFNRGALLNIGYALAEASGASHIALHDVDFVPHVHVSELYTKPLSEGARHVLGRVDSAGGVVVVEPWMYRLVNGHANCFWGWGFEDHDLMERLRSVGVSMDRSHWLPGSFTSFQGFNMLRDCDGMHGNRTGCAKRSERNAAAHEGDVKGNSNQVEERIDGHTRTGSTHPKIDKRTLNIDNNKDVSQEANRVRFLAARAVSGSPDEDEDAAWENSVVGTRFPRHLACGLMTADFAFVRPPEGCGIACVRVYVSLGRHEWCEAL